MFDVTTRRLVTLCTSLILVAAASGAGAAEDGTLKYRQSVMRSVGGHTGAIAQIVLGKVSRRSHLAVHTAALAELSTLVTAAFEERAAQGKTRARAKIWNDWPGFEGKARDFEKAAAKLAVTARSGGNLVAAFKATTETCKGCHKGFRKKQQ